MSLTPEEQSVVITSVAAVVTVLLGAFKLYRDNKVLADMGLKAIAFVAEQVAAKTANTYDDKAALFLKHLSGQAAEKGVKVSEAKARALFDKLQGKEAK